MRGRGGGGGKVAGRGRGGAGGRRTSTPQRKVAGVGGGDGCVICPLSAPIFLPHSQPQLRGLCRMLPFPTLPRKPGASVPERERERWMAPVRPPCSPGRLSPVSRAGPSYRPARRVHIHGGRGGIGALIFSSPPTPLRHLGGSRVGAWRAHPADSPDGENVSD